MLLSDFIIQNESLVERETGLKSIYDCIISASKKISREVNRAALAGILGKANKENVQGEEVMKLDELANDWLIGALMESEYCAGVASEELEEFTAFPQATNDKAQYLVLFDPLDGSGNIDTGASIGTIFSIVKRRSKGELLLSDYLQKGNDILSAGYVLYGSSTIFIYSMGNGVNGFTLEQEKNEYYLSHPNIQTPTTANQFSVNTGNYRGFRQGLRDFIDWCCEEDKATKRPYSQRYIGSMVGDFHRNLIKGGIFIYPATDKTPKGKLRLLYECIPLSFVQEQAGGKSCTNEARIMDIEPTELHQRTSIALGSLDLVDKYLSFKDH